MRGSSPSVPTEPSHIRVWVATPCWGLSVLHGFGIRAAVLGFLKGGMTNPHQGRCAPRTVGPRAEHRHVDMVVMARTHKWHAMRVLCKDGFLVRTNKEEVARPLWPRPHLYGLSLSLALYLSLSRSSRGVPKGVDGNAAFKVC